MTLLFLIGFGMICAVHSSGLVDHSIAADTIQYLDSAEWTATSDNGRTIRATVPGDLITDLQMSGMIGDPLYELNWLKYSSIWDDHVWTYSTQFAVDVQSLASGTSVLLVFDGIKMSSSISLNGVPLLKTTNQFLRYISDPIDHSILKPINTLTVSFDPKDQTTEGRFMACTGGWDWAPYSNTVTKGYGADGPESARTLSKGIWKSVYVAYVSTVALTDVVPLVFYDGSFPTSPITKATKDASFTVSIRTHFWTAQPTSGTLTVGGAWGNAHNVSMLVNLPKGKSNVTVQLSASISDIELWWPAGIPLQGTTQQLYSISTTFTPASSPKNYQLERKIGFRYVVVVTGNDTDPNWAKQNANADGSANHGMIFRVNGAPIYARGANMIPIDNFEGRYSADTLIQMVKSARDANFNFLRVWGGGVFLPQAFYDACDSFGIMIYHDMQFAQEGHSPSQSSPADQREEFRHQARRLSNHPSLVMYDGCNECQVYIGTDTAVYATFVLKTIVEEDTSRVVWPSCPSMGWQNGVNRLSAHPNNSPLGLVPNYPRPPATNKTCVFVADTDVNASGWSKPGKDENDCCQQCYNDTTNCAGVVFYQGTCWFKTDSSKLIPNPGRVFCNVVNRPAPLKTIEEHGPYQHGSGWPAVNGDSALIPIDSGYPINVDPTVKMGMQHQNIFASEFGASVFSSFESTAPTLSPNHWSSHGGSSADNCTDGFDKLCNGTNVMAQRNYPCDSPTVSYFGYSDWGAVGELAFKKQLWQCMISQALNVKMKIETKRVTNVFGTFVWQFGEIWPTGGWGSIEYGIVGFTPGQVIGGRWKPLHYWYKNALFTEVFVTCGAGGHCLLKNDQFVPLQNVLLQVTKTELSSGVTTVVFSQTVNVAAGPGVPYFFTIDSSISGTEYVLQGTVTDGSSNAVLTNNFIPLMPPVNWTMPSAKVTFQVSPSVNPDGTVDITVSSDKVAAFVTLTSLAQGRFSDNAFFMTPGSRVVQYIPFVTPTDIGTLTTTLRVEHMASYA